MYLDYLARRDLTEAGLKNFVAARAEWAADHATSDVRLDGPQPCYFGLDGNMFAERCMPAMERKLDFEGFLAATGTRA